MEKIIGLVLVTIYAGWFFTGQTQTMAEDIIVKSNQEVLVKSKQEVSIIENTPIETKLTHTKMYEAIKLTVESKGWITTEFKRNTLVAEKIKDNDTLSVTITFSKDSFSILPKNEELQSAINNTLNT